jgi:hypothetical protein
VSLNYNIFVINLTATENGTTNASAKQLAKTQATAPRPEEGGMQGVETRLGKATCRKPQWLKHVQHCIYMHASSQSPGSCEEVCCLWNGLNNSK